MLNMSWSEAKEIMRQYGVNDLLSRPESNPKIAKNGKVGVLCAPLHLAPHKLSGFNVCAKASPECIAACLHTAGNVQYMPGKTRARLARTKAYFKARAAFMAALYYEIARLERKAKRENMLCGIRLNATSDITFESVPVGGFANIMEAFPAVQFYDYTKRSNRKNLPVNYDLTFSLAENNDREAVQAFRNGMNIAVVFNVRRGKPLPKGFTLGQEYILPVIDGDLHDYRPIDPRNCIVGLRAKGKAIGSNGGFVREAFP